MSLFVIFFFKVAVQSAGLKPVLFKLFSAPDCSRFRIEKEKRRIGILLFPFPGHAEA